MFVSGKREFFVFYLCVYFAGTMQDYNYVHGTFEMLIGIACCRNENKTEALESIWKENKDVQ